MPDLCYKLRAELFKVLLDSLHYRGTEVANFLNDISSANFHIHAPRNWTLQPLVNKYMKKFYRGASPMVIPYPRFIDTEKMTDDRGVP